MFIGGGGTVLLAKALGGMANMLAGNAGFGGSLLHSFLMAGGTEEAAKLLMILLALVILKSRVKNVYEYALIGAAVGFGFAVAEEFYYGNFSAGSGAAEYITLVERTISVPAHMTFSMVMAELLGRARFSRLTGKGSPALDCVLAMLDRYDLAPEKTVETLRQQLDAELEKHRFRKKTGKFCGMHFSAAEPAA